jgi:hypothetical protein
MLSLFELCSSGEMSSTKNVGQPLELLLQGLAWHVAALTILNAATLCGRLRPRAFVLQG